MNQFSQHQIKTFLKQTFFAGLFLSVTVYAWVRALLFEDPFSIREDGITILKTIGTGWVLMMTIRAAWYLLLLIGESARQWKMPTLAKPQWAIRIIAVIFLSSILYACNA